MKISLNTIRQYIDFELPSVDELVSRINQQLGQVEEVVDLSAKYQDIVIVKVVECEKHPNADKLHVCLVDDGGAVENVERDENGRVQVVCGASNVHAGMFAAWLPPRSTVPASFGTAEPFVLGARELRGVVSNGMLASAKELAIGDDHAGIIEITENDLPKSKIQNLKSGEKFAELFGLDDTVLDIENKMFTHRPDCFGQLGVAREIAGILGHAFKSPAWYVGEPVFESRSGLELKVFNEAGEKCPRFTAVVLKDVTVKPSPLWLQIELVRLGGKPINTIVDMTNYVMLLTAQPTHAYDYDKLREQTLGVRMAKQGEKCTLLNGKEYELTEDDIVIVDGEGVVGLGGVMGGGNSEVSDDTKNVVLECATFDMYTIRKTSMRYGLFTDAVTRFNKGQSPEQQVVVQGKLVELIVEIAGGTQASEIFDSRQPTADSRQVMVTSDFINARLGLKLTQAEIANLLENVEFDAASSDEQMTVHIPFWRTDIDLPEDIVEEVGRLYGFDKLPCEMPRRSITPAAKNPVFEVKKRVREQLSRAGANEVLTYSFVHADVLQKAGQDALQAYQLSNALSPDLQYYRLSLTPSLLEKIHPNIKAGHDEFALFELGKAHRVGDVDDEGLPREYKRLALVWAAKKTDKTGYFVAKQYLEVVAPNARFVPLSDCDVAKYEVFEQLAKPFEPKRAAVIMDGENFVGVVGEYTAAVRKAFKLPEGAVGFEMFQAYLMKVQPRPYVPLSRFPKVSQDISLKVPASTDYQSVFSLVQKTVHDHQPGDCEIALEPLSIYQADNDGDHKTITLRLVIASYEKTLSDKDVNQLMEKVAAEAEKHLNAERI